MSPLESEYGPDALQFDFQTGEWPQQDLDLAAEAFFDEIAIQEKIGSRGLNAAQIGALMEERVEEFKENLKAQALLGNAGFLIGRTAGPVSRDLNPPAPRGKISTPFKKVNIISPEMIQKNPALAQNRSQLLATPTRMIGNLIYKTSAYVTNTITDQAKKYLAPTGLASTPTLALEKQATEAAWKVIKTEIANHDPRLERKHVRVGSPEVVTAFNGVREEIASVIKLKVENHDQRIERLRNNLTPGQERAKAAINEQVYDHMDDAQFHSFMLDIGPILEGKIGPESLDLRRAPLKRMFQRIRSFSDIENRNINARRGNVRAKQQQKIDFVEADINKGFRPILQSYLVKRSKMGV